LDFVFLQGIFLCYLFSRLGFCVTHLDPAKAGCVIVIATISAKGRHYGIIA
jgi:hypothetical protein